MNRLPDELWRGIAGFMDHPTLCAWRLTCTRNACNYDQQLKTLYIKSDTKITTDDLSTLTYLTELSLYDARNKTGLCMVVSKLVSLTTLHTYSGVTNEDIMQLTALTSLSLMHNVSVTAVSLNRLQYLYLHDDIMIPGKDIMSLSSLTSLTLSGNHTVFNWHITAMTNLQILSIGYDEHISMLPCGITSLDISSRNLIRDDAILALPLTTLKLRYNNVISGATVSKLTGLTLLDLSYADRMNDAELAVLTNLHTLNLNHNHSITSVGIHDLTNLTSLRIRDCLYVDDTGIRALTRLQYLSMGSRKGICPWSHVMPMLTRLKLQSPYSGGTGDDDLRRDNACVSLTTLDVRRCSDLDILDLPHISTLQTIIVRAPGLPGEYGALRSNSQARIIKRT